MPRLKLLRLFFFLLSVSFFLINRFPPPRIDHRVFLDANAYGAHLNEAQQPGLQATDQFTADDDFLNDDDFWDAKISEILAGDNSRNVDQANEVNRVMTTFNLNPYEILNVRFDASPRNISATYRKVAALIHPDKCSHPAAREAFERVKESYDALRSNKTSSRLRYMIGGTRKMMLEEKESELRKAGIGSSLVNDLLDGKDKNTETKDDPVIKALADWQKSDEFHHEWKMRLRESLIQAEWRIQRHEEYNAGAEERRKLYEREKNAKLEAERERKRQWEAHRDSRIRSWHEFLRHEEERVQQRKKLKLGEDDSVNSDGADTIDSDTVQRIQLPYKFPDEGPRLKPAIQRTLLMEEMPQADSEDYRFITNENAFKT